MTALKHEKEEREKAGDSSTDSSGAIVPVAIYFLYNANQQIGGIHV